jgi:hypothetical protein
MTMNRKVFLMALPLAALLWAPLSAAADRDAPKSGVSDSRKERDHSRHDTREERVARRGGREGSGRHEERKDGDGTEVTNGRRQTSARDKVDAATKSERPAKCEGDPADCWPRRGDIK